MLSSTPELDAASFVILGNFSPGIFHPAWLAHHNLIRETEAASVESIVVTNEYARFQADWFLLEAMPDRLTLITNQTPYQTPLRDLVESILSLLPTTPISAVGINNSAHFKMKDIATWHTLGHRLVPKDPFWSGSLKDPGTQRVVVKGERDDDHLGHVVIIIEPSNRIEHAVFLEINDHFARPSSVGPEDGTEWVIAVITSNWQAHQNRIEKTRGQLLEFAILCEKEVQK